MIAQDVITLARQHLNDPISTGRWSDSALLNFLNEAQQELIRDIQTPPGRLITMTRPGIQEYHWPDDTSIITIYRVYVAGQLIVPTDKATLNAEQIYGYDQGFGSGIPEPGVPSPGSGGPPGTQGSFTPAWNVQAPLAYPVPNCVGTPAPLANPWSVGQRPKYYWDGGVIGLVPIPAQSCVMEIEGLIAPPQLVTLQDTLWFPFTCKRALSYFVEMQAYSADDQPTSEQKSQSATMNYERTMRKLRMDAMSQDGQPKLPRLLTYRGFYQKGSHHDDGYGPHYP